MSTVANANLNLTGTEDRSMLTGTITILRTGFNPQSDFSSLLANPPNRSHSVGATGLLGGMNFDIQIDTAPDINFKARSPRISRPKPICACAAPSAIPRSGPHQHYPRPDMFFGTKYTINQGSVEFL